MVKVTFHIGEKMVRASVSIRQPLQTIYHKKAQIMMLSIKRQFKPVFSIYEDSGAGKAETTE